MIRLDSLAAIKREIKRIAGNNKIVKREAMLIRGTPTEQTRAEAEIDNETAGPGLRRGPMRRSYNRQGGGDARPDTWGEVPAGQEYKGWDNYPKQGAFYPMHPMSGCSLLTSLEEPQPAATAEPALTPDTSVPPSPGLSTSVSESVDLSTPPSILETHEPDTPSEHFHHAQQAMMLASQGGLVAALSRQPDSAPEGDPSEDESKIGRSLFLALDTVTSEKDESVVLEIGWAALWWQPVKPEDVTGEFEEMREAGHFMSVSCSASHIRTASPADVAQYPRPPPHHQERRNQARPQRQVCFRLVFADQDGRSVSHSEQAAGRSVQKGWRRTDL